MSLNSIIEGIIIYNIKLNNTCMKLIHFFRIKFLLNFDGGEIQTIYKFQLG